MPTKLNLSSHIVRRLLQRYWRFTRGLTMGAQGLVLDRQDRVLLVRHAYREGWHFPGGGVEKNEVIGDALARELQEETGVIIDGAPQFVGMFAHFKDFPSDHIALFVIKQWSCPVIPEPNMEIAAQKFYAMHDLPDGTTKGTRARLREYFEGLPPAAHW